VHDTTTCLNCGAAAPARYCPECGQETRVHVPSLREFLHEFVGHYVALEGKLWQTLRQLVFVPGGLTAAYLAGRRQRFVLPLRVFLSCSILFFALLRFANPPHLDGVAVPPQGAQPSAQFDNGFSGGTSKLGALSPSIQRKLDEFNALDNHGRAQMIVNGFFSYAPYAIVLLMPVFALYLKLLYLGTGRRYGEHVLFALHTNAFAYLMLALMVVLPFFWVRIALLAWLALYMPFALQRVYGGRKRATVLRWLVLMLLHLVSIGYAIVGALLFAVVH
jgi:hypothetical protein